MNKFHKLISINEILKYRSRWDKYVHLPRCGLPSGDSKPWPEDSGFRKREAKSGSGKGFGTADEDQWSDVPGDGDIRAESGDAEGEQARSVINKPSSSSGTCLSFLTRVSFRLLKDDDCTRFLKKLPALPLSCIAAIPKWMSKHHGSNCGSYFLFWLNPQAAETTKFFLSLLCLPVCQKEKKNLNFFQQLCWKWPYCVGGSQCVSRDTDLYETKSLVLVDERLDTPCAYGQAYLNCQPLASDAHDDLSGWHGTTRCRLPSSW